MILGQLVAISVALALFLTAVYLHEPIPNRKPKAPLMLCFLLISAQVAMFILPELADQPAFVHVLGFIHGAVVVPLFFIPKNGRNESGSLPFGGLFALLVVLAAIIHTFTTVRVLDTLPSAKWLPSYLYKVFLSHPAQASVSWDVVWVAITFAAWWLVSGSATSIVAKSTLVATVGGVAAARHFGVNWYLLGSFVPIVALLLVAGAAFGLSTVRSRNDEKRAAVLGKLGIKEEGVIPGTSKEPPTMAKKRRVVGFWHPYW
jgi:alpha-1,2-mannosyltransferase